MNHLSKNLTFAVLKTENNWRTDLTVRFCEYFSYILNSEEFTSKIIFVDSIDEALEQCTTKYLLVQSSGNIIFHKNFFQLLNGAIEKNEDIFIGNIILAHDYLYLQDNCIFFNMNLWNKLDRPRFNSNLREGPRFTISEYTESKYHPAKIAINTEDTDNIFVTNSCSSNGASLVITQLREYGNAKSFSSICKNKELFYLDKTTPYLEIHNETVFEKKYLAEIKKVITSLDSDSYNLKNISADIVVAPAHGLKCISLAEYFKCKKLIIYDSNPLSLEFQKLIFSVKNAVPYGEIVEEFQKTHPNINLDTDWIQDKWAVVMPLRNLHVEYVLTDIISFESEDLIKKIDYDSTLVFDFSNLFVYPYNYYKRNLYQVQGLFAELYSLLKSRTGPTHILGHAPGFQSMDSIDVNTSRVQFEMDPTVQPEELELTQEMLDEAALKEGLQPIAYEEEVIQPLVVAKELQVVSKDITASAIKIAEDLGYIKIVRYEIINNEGKNIIVLYKNVIFDEFTALFEYYFDEYTYEWSFKVSKIQGDKKIEFSNGQTVDSFIKHINQEIKINPKTAIKYL